METNSPIPRELSPLFVVTKYRPQVPYSSDDESASPTQRHARVSVKERAERYIGQAAVSPQTSAVVTADTPDSLVAEEPNGIQKPGCHGRAHGVARSNFQITPDVFSIGGDGYLRHLGAQYNRARSTERAEKIGRHSIPFSSSPRVASEGQVERGDNRSPSITSRSLIECESAEGESVADYDEGHSASDHRSCRGEGVEGRPGSFRPAAPPVKKIMRRQSNTVQHREQLQPKLTNHQPPRRVSPSAVPSLLAHSEMLAAKAFRMATPSSLTAPKSLSNTYKGTKIIVDYAPNYLVSGPSSFNEPGPSIVKVTDDENEEMVWRRARSNAESSRPMTPPASGARRHQRKSSLADALIDQCPRTPKSPVTDTRSLRRQQKPPTSSTSSLPRNRSEWLDRNSPTSFKSAVHTVAIYDKDIGRAKGTLPENGNIVNGGKRVNRGGNSASTNGRMENQRIGHGKIDRRSPAARFFASEYEQMLLAGYEEDTDDTESSFLKPTAPRTTRTTRSPRNVRTVDPRNEYIVCSMQDLRELLSDKDSDRGSSYRSLNRSAFKPQRMVTSSHKCLVDRSAQTNGELETEEKVRQQKYANGHRRQQEQNRSATSDYTQHHQTVDVQRHRAVKESGFIDGRQSTDNGNGQAVGWTSPSWRRMYFVATPTDIVKNCISRSEEVLNEDRYAIDLRGLKDRFADKADHAPMIQRLGRVWEPPPEKPYEFPRPRAPYKRFVEFVQEKENVWRPGFQYGPDIQYERRGMPQLSPEREEQMVATPMTVMVDSEIGYHSPAPSFPIGRESRTPGNQSVSIGEGSPEVSPAYSSLAFSDEQSATRSDIGTPQPRGRQSAVGVRGLENEPTPRHPSTMTAVDKPKINVHDKILTFETEGGRIVSPCAPRREFGIYHTRQDAVRPASTDDGLNSNSQSPGDRRSVRFADSGRVEERRIEPPPSIGGKKDLDDLAELAERRERLLDRARHRSAVNIHELRKVEADVPPVPTRERYKELLEEAACFETYTLVNGTISQQQQQSASVNHKLPNELTRSQSLVNSEYEYTTRQPKSLSQTNLASWKFSGAGFSPRSVVSINGHQDLGDQLRIRTDLSPATVPTRQIVHKSNAAVQTQLGEPQPQQPQFWPAVLVPVGAAGTPTSTTTREYKEETKRSHEVEKYSSLNELDEGSRQGTMIKIQDDSARRPKSIMKPLQRRREDEKQLVAKEWDVVEQREVNGGGEVVRQVAPKVTETVSTVEEVKRTEEVERRVRESKDKKRSSKKKSGGSSSRHRESRQQRSSSSSHGWGPRPGDADYPPWTAPFGESPNAMWRQQQAITANGHAGSQKYNGGQQVTESYHRQTTTKRITGNNDRHTVFTSRSPSPGETRVQYHYGPDGSYNYVRWMTGGSSGEVRHQNGHQRSSGRRNRVHKSQSSREVYHNDLPEDYEDTRGSRGPIVEYPPTLPRDQNGHPIRVTRNGDGASDMSLHKSRSYHDWNKERGKDTSLMRKWEADVSGLERDFRDSLLMPMPGPGQNVNQREYREEEIPGGRETFSREVHANSGSKPGTAGANTKYSEAKQETSYRREQATDRRPY